MEIKYALNRARYSSKETKKYLIKLQKTVEHDKFQMMRKLNKTKETIENYEYLLEKQRIRRINPL